MHVSRDSYSIGFFIATLLCVRSYLVFASPTRGQPVEHLSPNLKRVPVRKTYFELDSPDGLVKRQCVESKTEVDKGGNPKWECDGVQVTLAEIHEKIASKGYASGRTTMFYTALGGAKGVATAKCWANKHPKWIDNSRKNPGYVMFDQVCDNKWTAAVVQDAKRNGGRDDEVLKCKSQALAEQASGDVYFFIPKGVTAKSDSAWIGWELPALQRNRDVTNVWRVDPNDPEWDSDQYDASGSKRVNIWKKDGKIDTNPPLC